MTAHVNRPTEILIRTYAVLSNVSIERVLPALLVTIPGDPPLHGAIEGAEGNDSSRFAIPRIAVSARYTVEPAWLDSMAAVAEGTPDPDEPYFPLGGYPSDLQGFVINAGVVQRAALRRLIELFRWRTYHDTWAGRTVRANPTHEWSRDGSTWHSLPVSMSLSFMREPSGARLTAELQESLNGLLSQGAREPHAWDVFHDARAARDRGDARSAVIMAVSAVEVEIKRLIAQFVPDAEWLIMNLQAPPTFRLVRDYLPQLPGVPAELLPPKHLRTQLHSAVELRNDLVHAGGRRGVAREDIESEVANACNDVLAMASDLLLLFDAYRGQAWALEHLSARTREALGQRG